MKNNINFIKLNFISPTKIQKWSSRLTANNNIFYGEVTSTLFYDYNDNKIEPNYNGLFSEQIFGPLIDFSCQCNFDNSDYIFQDCPVCKITLTFSFVRNYRMGYIPLIIPMLHTWFLWSSTNILNICFNLSTEVIKKSLYFNISKSKYSQLYSELMSFISEKNRTYDSNYQKTEKLKMLLKTLEKDLILAKTQLLKKKNNAHLYTLCKEKKTITNQINNLLANYNIKDELIKTFKTLYLYLTSSINIKQYSYYIKKYRILENLLITKTDPSWIFLKYIPVMPPEFRPFDDEDDSDNSFYVNILYQNILKKNKLLKFLFDEKNRINNKEFLILSEIRALQESIDFLIDHLKLKTKETLNKKPVKSLSSVIRGKFGRFRSTILGKRVNFSARSVIIVNSQLKLNQCGVPFNILKVLFNDFIENIVEGTVENNKFSNISSLLQYKIIKHLLFSKTILLNRAPTLHRFGIQAFNPIIISGNAIQIHPLICASYNADFDGDQMSIHLPLTKLSELEIKTLLKSTDSLYSFFDKKLKPKFSQDLILGLVYLTMKLQTRKLNGYYFDSYNDVLNCFNIKKITCHTPIWFKLNNNTINKNFIRTTFGRLLLTNLLLKKQNDFN